MKLQKHFWTHLSIQPVVGKTYELAKLGKAIRVTKLFYIPSFGMSPWIARVEVYTL